MSPSSVFIQFHPLVTSYRVRPHPCFRGSFGRWFIFREVLRLLKH
jgi:hypothetical protein